MTCVSPDLDALRALCRAAGVRLSPDPADVETAARFIRAWAYSDDVIASLLAVLGLPGGARLDHLDDAAAALADRLVPQRREPRANDGADLLRCVACGAPDGVAASRPGASARPVCVDCAVAVLQATQADRDDVAEPAPPAPVVGAPEHPRGVADHELRELLAVGLREAGLAACRPGARLADVGATLLYAGNVVRDLADRPAAMAEAGPSPSPTPADPSRPVDPHASLPSGQRRT